VSVVLVEGNFLDGSLINPGIGSGERSRCPRGECRRRRPKLRQLSQILSGGGEQELVSRAGGSTQAQTTKPEDAFEMGEEHRDFLAQMSRLSEGRRAGEGSSKIAGLLIKVAWNLTMWRVGASGRMPGNLACWRGRAASHP
jgi:hypothetical protein